MQLLQLPLLVTEPPEAAHHQGLLHGPHVPRGGQAHDEHDEVQELRLPELFAGVQEQANVGHPFAHCLRPGAEVPLPLLRPEEQAPA